MLARNDRIRVRTQCETRVSRPQSARWCTLRGLSFRLLVGLRSQRFKSRLGLPLAQRPKSSKGGLLAVTGDRPALFPVIHRLAGHTRKPPEIRCGQPQSSTQRAQTLGAKAGWGGIIVNRNLVTTAFQGCDCPVLFGKLLLQCRDIVSEFGIGFAQEFDLGADFLAGKSGYFTLEHVGKCGHDSIYVGDLQIVAGAALRVLRCLRPWRRYGASGGIADISTAAG